MDFLEQLFVVFVVIFLPRNLISVTRCVWRVTCGVFVSSISADAIHVVQQQHQQVWCDLYGKTCVHNFISFYHISAKSFIFTMFKYNIMHIVPTSRSQRRCSTRSWPGTTSSVRERPRRVHDDENSHQQRLVVVLRITQADTNHQAISANARSLSTLSSQALYTVVWTTAMSCSQDSQPVTSNACSPSSMPPYDWTRVGGVEDCGSTAHVFITWRSCIHRRSSLCVEQVVLTSCDRLCWLLYENLEDILI